MSFPPAVEPGPPLSDAELFRYARHLTLPGFGGDGQRRLRNARVLVIGAGGLGSPILMYLAAAGIGHITVLDDDLVELSNLQRQVLHSTATLGQPKVESARTRLSELNPGTQITTIRERLTSDNALELFASHDIAIDGADNFATRYLSNDAAEITGTPLVWGTIFQFGGQLSVFWPSRGPMLRDLFPDTPDPDFVPSCSVGGVLGSMVGQVGSMMATEAIKVITGVGEPAVGKLVIIDSLTTSLRTLNFTRDPARPPVTSVESTAPTCDDVPVTEIGPGELRGLLGSSKPPLLIDVRTPDEVSTSSILGAINVPLDDVLSQGWAALPEVAGRDVVFSCHSGSRSAMAVRALADSAPEGTELSSLRSGILGWQASSSG